MLKNIEQNNQDGAALITVVMIGALLSIACIAILTGVGSNSRNSTDVLSETKAYYASESGLQSAINVLRNDPNPAYGYKDAVLDPTLATKLTYNCSTPETSVSVGLNPCTANGTSYSVFVTDPDDSAGPSTYFTTGVFLEAPGGTISGDGKTVYYPNSSDPSRVEIAFTPAPSSPNNYTSNPSLGSFSRTTFGSGVIPTSTKIEFRINYHLTAPHQGTTQIFGNIERTASALNLKFQTQNYSLAGSDIELCALASTPTPCVDIQYNLLTTSNPEIFANITATEPTRLKVVSTGYGPNGSRKQLEGIVKRNLFGGLASGAATTLIGPSTGFRFEPGTSNGITYSGGDCSVSCVPSFGLTNPGTYNYVDSHPPGPAGGDPDQYAPGPAILDSSAIPEWQQSPTNLEELVNDARIQAKNSSRYFANPSGNQANFNVGSNPNPPGNFTTGKGITFCEGSCKIGASGGGLLIVTGKLTNVGGFKFRGIIIVTGAEGWERNGAGNGQVIGNVIIAPYYQIPYIPYPGILSTAFLPPQYYVTGGGTSDLIYDDVSGNLDGIGAISNIMAGVAEK